LTLHQTILIRSSIDCDCAGTAVQLTIASMIGTGKPARVALVRNELNGSFLPAH
jgi:hypothetical protein